MASNHSAHTNEQNTIIDSQIKSSNREIRHGQPCFERDDKKFSSFGMPDSALKQKPPPTKVKYQTTDEECQPVHEEFPINAQNAAIILEKKQDTTLTQTNRDNDEKTATTGAEHTKSLQRHSRLTATQKRAKSITNYYNILSQHIQDK